MPSPTAAGSPRRTTIPPAESAALRGSGSERAIICASCSSPFGPLPSPRWPRASGPGWPTAGIVSAIAPPTARPAATTSRATSPASAPSAGPPPPPPRRRPRDPLGVRRDLRRVAARRHVRRAAAAGRPAVLPVFGGLRLRAHLRVGHLGRRGHFGLDHPRLAVGGAVAAALGGRRGSGRVLRRRDPARELAAGDRQQRRAHVRRRRRLGRPRRHAAARVVALEPEISPHPIPAHARLGGGQRATLARAGADLPRAPDMADPAAAPPDGAPPARARRALSAVRLRPARLPRLRTLQRVRGDGSPVGRGSPAVRSCFTPAPRGTRTHVLLRIIT